MEFFSMLVLQLVLFGALSAMPLREATVRASLSQTRVLSSSHSGQEGRESEVIPAETESSHSAANVPQSSRVKRAPRIPLSETFNEDNFKNSGLSGSIVYVARKSCHIRFDVDPQRFSSKEIMLAELMLYKIRPRSLKFLKKAKAKQTRKARVTIHQVIRAGKYISETKLLDTRRVHVKASGWMKFDITATVKAWSQDPSLNHGLEIWVESTEPGDFAAKVARKFRFAKPGDKEAQHRPSLLLVFKNTDSKSS